MSNRIYGIDWCKVIAMLMICSLHYIGHGGVISSKNDIIASGGGAFKSFAIGAVNLYMLATGYLMYGKTFKIKRIVRIWTETFFYSVLMGGIVIFLTRQWGLRDIVKSCLPVISIEYWYITAYIVLLLFSPALNITVSGLDKKNAYGLLGLIVVFFSLWKSIFPNNGLLETGYLQGYGIVWMMCMYLFGAIIKKYPPYISKKNLIFGIYLVCSMLIFCVSMLGRNMHILDDGNKVFDYNHIFVLCGSVSLFLILLHIPNNNSLVSTKISTISNHTLAVYLIQEQFRLKDILWTLITDFVLKHSYIIILLFSVMAIILVFSTCILIDILRKKIFERLQIDETVTKILEKLAYRIGLV